MNKEAKIKFIVGEVIALILLGFGFYLALCPILPQTTTVGVLGNGLLAMTFMIVGIYLFSVVLTEIILWEEATNG